MTARNLRVALGRLRRLAATPGGADPTDRQLLQRFAASRDEDAFEALLLRHGPLVLGVCRRVLGQEQDAEDAFQATFLVLARKAATTRWQDSVAHWLYEVAHRLASEARVRSARRRAREGRAAQVRKEREMPRPDLQQVGAVLEEELRNLPPGYREPLLLCSWQGLTRDQAARRLGVPLRTLDRRLARGRVLLRGRLERRGLALPAALLAVGLSQGAGTAQVP